jgi:hypothetical protein
MFLHRTSLHPPRRKPTDSIAYEVDLQLRQARESFSTRARQANGTRNCAEIYDGPRWIRSVALRSWILSSKNDAA